jgi:DNA-damage-inducible protein J
MNSTVINIKTDIKIKKEAQKITSDLGLSLSGAINGFLKQLIRDKTVLFTLNENIPSAYLLSSIKESKSERKSGKFHSFKNNQEAINFLDRQ